MLALRARTRHLTVLLSAFAIAASLAHACGDHEPSNGITVTCAEACARCPTNNDLCGDCAGWGARLRDEFESALYPCIVRGADAGCPRDWERCVEEAMGVAGERDIDRAFRDVCLARRTECQNQMMGFADDDCLTSGAFIESAVTEARPCIVKPCAEVQTCLRDAFQ